ncbi:MAG: hypothetical protein M9964_04390 [Solirubrobacterales bacterium]|nr:hypothetical protein [Solirubrobacterales bacterium]
MTARMVEAVSNPLVDCLGHPSGRLLLKREPYEFDVEAVIAAVAEHGTMIEINGSPRRRDLNEHHARMAAEAGVMICVNTDAHRISTLENMVFGVATARRAGLTKEQVANTRPWRSFNALRKKNRSLGRGRRRRGRPPRWGSRAKPLHLVPAPGSRAGPPRRARARRGA